MRIIAHRILKEFYKKYSDAKSPLEDWYQRTKKSEWKNFAEIKETFNSVNGVGNQQYVFNIKGNDFRLVVRILFKQKIVYIRFVGTHNQYDNIEEINKI
ncbi:MAG: type II toxin-antitoxin system HigB family toxin [Prevotellaceae bacterium]|jgi:mRNA interferase HigB|nr:type II toxin-antitoxin system HigB family toxin [Prevotellaceae bacterium]